MKIDRELQRQILIELTEQFPKPAREEFLQELQANHSEEHIDGNLMYLEMHGMIRLKITRFLSGNYDITLLGPTEKAFDFLADDGGLTAALGVVTVKLHADTIRDLLTAKIQQTDLPAEEKHLLIKSVEALPEASLKHLTTKLIDYAVDQAPNIGRLLGTFVGL